MILTDLILFNGSVVRHLNFERRLRYRFRYTGNGGDLSTRAQFQCGSL